MVSLKNGSTEMLATETAIFRNSYFQRTPLTGSYSILLKCLEPEPLAFENIAVFCWFYSKKSNQGHLKRIFNSHILWNLEFAIFDFTRYKTLTYTVRFPYSSLMHTKQIKICLLWFNFLTVLRKFYEKSTPRLSFLWWHWPLHIKWK